MTDSSNVGLSARRVEMGIGISFATVLRGADVLKGRKLRQVSLRKLFGADHISLATRKQYKPPPYLTGFISHVLK